MKLLRENLNQNSVCQKHKANKHSTRKTIGCFAETIGCLYQFTNIKLKLKSLRIERFVRMDGFKLEGGELFKENFRKLLKQE